MRRKSIRQNSGQLSQNRRFGDQNHDEQGTQINGKDKKSSDEYKCGKSQCGKLYHSYTAFYNHCKKSHEGIFPSNSLYNGKSFQGPSKNRGRPRIKKTDVKDSVQIESLKTQNELIQFLGTLPKKKKNQELIVYVANPIEQLSLTIQYMNQFGNAKDYKQFISDLLQCNRIVVQNDLPDFYDPIQIQEYSDKMDSYNYLSMYNFLTNEQKIKDNKLPCQGIKLMRIIMVIWLTRILSIPLLAQVVYTVAQIDKGIDKIDEKQYMVGKTLKFKQLIQKYFDCILNEQSSTKPITNSKFQSEQ